ncbi:Putative enoyl-CoA hydratase, nodulation protein N like [Neorhizobium galegae bv. officinalis bv. officinalis str. HAMBI 1141]|uniref:Putative enoyl-CoA hydratase, nodulation protein N like n=1 Tax=Neorhizobium galegae bv. officinalis bv. officinalis str. HAMBI 1141 TaxID=1028801 RepID=A0A068TDH6_NEOGA|nr:MaoC family dehydratase [Neorhizobium galegae]CDN55385.1 Putative enoyl-CoA hydratase, nodulation protein N like [Neorhizobium galegae bv. officinalis bv. officinalis str. HAMBI 1141]
MREISLTEVEGLVGTEVGVSEWITVDQPMIDLFANATHDHQFIHVDPERATAESPFGGTIAHGFLTLSLLSAMNFDCVPRIREQTMGINYGFDRIRFMSPVKSGSRIRGHFTLAETRFRGAGMLMTTYDVSVEIENERKLALTAIWITIIQFDPKDRPEGL